MADRMLDRVLVVLGLDTKTMQTGVRSAEQSLRAMSRNLKQVGTDLTFGLTAPLAAIAVAATKAQVDFQTAMAHVTKNVDASEKKIAQLGQQFIDLSEEIPVAATELANIAEIAGALGIQTDSIIGFTKTVAALDLASELNADEAARVLAQFSAVMGTAQTDVDRLASAIFLLGRKTVATVPQIAEMAQRIAGQGRVIGLTEGQVLGLAAAVSSAGIEAEAGGTAISKTLKGISDAAATGGKELTVFAQTAGITREAFKELVENDPSEAVLKFIEGMNNARIAGKNLNKILADLSFNDARLERTLLLLANSGDKAREAMEFGTKGFEENKELARVTALFYNLLGAELTELKNKFTNVTMELGEAFEPAIRDAIDAGKAMLDVARDIVKWMDSWDDSTKKVAGTLGILTAALGPATFALGLFSAAAATSLGGLAKIPGALKTVAAAFAGLFVTGAGGLIGSFTLNPIGPILVGITAALILGVKAWKEWKREVDETSNSLDRASRDMRFVSEEFGRFANIADQVGTASERAAANVKELSVAALLLERFRTEGQLAELSQIELPESDKIELRANLLQRRNEIQAQIDALTPPEMKIEVSIDAVSRREALRAAGFTAKEIAEAMSLDKLDEPGFGASDAFKQMEKSLAAVEAQARLLGPTFDLVSAKAGILQSSLSKILEDDPLSPKAKAIADEFLRLQRILADRRAGEEFRDWYAGVMDSIISSEKRLKEAGDALDENLQDTLERIQNVKKPPGVEEMEDARKEIEDFIKQNELVGPAAEEMRQKYEIEVQKIGQAARDAAAEIRINLGEEFSGAFSQIFTGFLEGNRDLKPLEVFRDAAIGVIGKIWTESLKKKLDFDFALKGNLMGDLLPTIGTFAKKGAELIGGLFGIVPQKDIEDIRAEVEARVGAKVGSVAVPSPGDIDIDISGINATLSNLSTSIQLRFVKIRDGVLTVLGDLGRGAGEALAGVGSTMVRGLSAPLRVGAGLIGGFAEDLLAALVSIGPGITNLVGSLRGMGDEMLTAVGNLPAAVGRVFSRVAGEALAALSNLDLVAPLREGARVVNDFARNLLDSFISVGAGVTRSLGSFTRAASEALVALRGLDLVAPLREGARIVNDFVIDMVDAFSSVGASVTRALGSLSGIVDTALESVRELPAAVGRVFSRVSSAALEALGGFPNLVRGLFSRAVDAAEGVGQSITDALSSGFSRAGLLAREFATGLIEAFRELGPVVSTITASLRGVGSSVLSAVGDVVDLLGNAFDKIGESAVDLGFALYTNLLNGFAAATNATKNFADSFASILSHSFNQVLRIARWLSSMEIGSEIWEWLRGGNLEEFGSKIAKFAGRVFDSLWNKISELGSKVSTVEIEIIPEAGSIKTDDLPKEAMPEGDRLIADFGDGLISHLDSAARTVRSIMARFGTTLVSTLDRAFQGALDLAGGFAGAFTGAFGRLGSAIESVIAGVGSLATRLGAGLTSGLESAFTTSLTLVREFVRSFVDAVSGLGGSVTSALSGLGGLAAGLASRLTSGLEGAFDRAVDLVDGFVDSFLGSISGVGESLSSSLSGIGRFASRLGTSLTSGLGEAFDASVDLVEQFVGSFVGRIAGLGSAISSSLGGLTTLATRLGAGLTSGLGRAFDSAAGIVERFSRSFVESIRGLGSSVASSLAGIGGAAAGLGSKLGASLTSELGGAFRSAVDLVSGFASSFVSAIGGLGESISGALSGVTDLASGLGRSLGDHLQSGLGTAFSSAVGLVRNFAGAFVDAISGLGGSIATALAGVADVASGLGASLTSGLGTAVATARDLVRGFAGSFVEAIAGLGDAIGSAVAGVRDVATGLGSGLTASLTAELGAAFSGAVDLVRGFAGSFVEAVGGLGTAISGSLAGIGEVAAGLGSSLTSGLGAAVDLVRSFSGSFVDAISRLGSSISGALEGLGELGSGLGDSLTVGLRSAFSLAVDIVGRFSGAFVDAVSGLGTSITRTLAGVGDLAAGLGSSLAAGLGAAFSSAVGLVSGFTDSFIGAIGGLGASIASELSGLADLATGLGASLTAELSDAFSASIALVKGFSGSFVEAIGGLSESIASALGGIGDLAKGFGSNLTSGLGSAFAGALDRMRGFVGSFVDILGGLGSAISSASSGVASLAGGLGSTLRSELGRAFSSAVELIGGFASSFVGAIGGLGSSISSALGGLGAIGSSVLSGIGALPGILSMVFGQIQGLVQGFAGELVSGLSWAFSNGLSLVGDFGRQFVGGLGSVFSQGLGLLNQFGGGALEILSALISQVAGGASGLGSAFMSALPAMLSFVGLQSGGITQKDMIVQVHAGEAVIPLSRLESMLSRVSGGGGGGGAPTININNQAADVVSVGQPSVTSGPSGEQIIGVTIERITRSSLARGALRQDMAQNYGMQPQPTMR